MKNRYPGSRSFERNEQTLFNGRSKEIQELYRLVKVEELVVLFSKSGLGKSSLLNAGLNPVLRSNFFFPIDIRLQDTDIDPLIATHNALKPFIDQDKLHQFSDAPTADKALLWEQINACIFLDEEGEEPCMPVLIFDQFEELFNHSEAAYTQFADQLADVVEDRLPEPIREKLRQIPRRERTPAIREWYTPKEVHVILAIRSDRMSELHKLTTELPAILKNRYELYALKQGQAQEAIVKPASLQQDVFKTAPFVYQEDTLDVMLDNLGNANKEVESFQLQILCQHVEDKVFQQEEKRKGKTVFATKLPPLKQDKKTHRIVVTPDYLGGAEGIRKILNNYYNDQITTLGTEGVQQKARILIEEGLIVGGRRVSVAEAVVQSNYGINDELLSQLVFSRLIRAQNTPLGKTYELSHDTLVAPILKSYEERSRTEAIVAQEKALETQRKRQARRLGLLGLLLLLTLFSVGSCVIFHEYRQAAEARDLAQEERDQASQAKKLAEQQGLEAQIQLMAAENARVVAEAEKVAANVAKAAANRSAALARKAEEEALQAKKLAEEEREDAIVEKEKAVVARQGAEEREQEAQRLKERAQDAEKDAQRQEKIAKEQKAKAQEQFEEASNLYEAAKRLTEVATAKNLALKSVNLNELRNPDLIRLLALKAYEINIDNGGSKYDNDIYQVLSKAADDLQIIPLSKDDIRTIIPTENALYLGGDDGNVYESKNGGSSLFEDYDEEQIRTLFAYNDGQIVAAGTNEGMLHLKNGRKQETIKISEGIVTKIGLHPNKRYLITADNQGIMTLLDFQGNLISGPLNNVPPITDFATNNQQNQIVVAFEDGTIRAYAITIDNRFKELARASTGQLKSVAFHRNGHTLIGGDKMGHLYVWELDAPNKTLKMVTKNPLHIGPINDVVFHPTNPDVFATASSDGTVKVGKVSLLASSSYEPIEFSDHTSWVWSVAFSSDGTQIISVGNDKQMHIATIEINTLINKICMQTKRKFTQAEWEKYIGDSSSKVIRSCE